MTLSHNPHVATSLARWHYMIASGDLGELHHLVHPKACFRSPMAFCGRRFEHAEFWPVSKC